MTMPRHSLRTAVICILFLAACGGDGTVTNLKPAFFRTVAGAPVTTLTLQRQSGTPMARATAQFDTRPLFDGWLKVGRTVTASANANGVAALALPAGSYPMQVDSGVPASTALVGKLNDTLIISSDTSRTYQTSQQNWTVTSPKAFNALSIAIYQVDPDGKALVGDRSSPLEPVVLTASPAVSGGNATQATFTTELFKGNYRAVISATPVTSSDTIAPFETASFQAAGGGASETQTAALQSGGNVVSLHFVQAGAPVPDNEIGQVLVYDAGSLVFLSSAQSSGGVATVNTGGVGPVVAIVETPDGQVSAAGSYTASPSQSATLNRYTVGGHVKAPGGAPLVVVNNNSYGNVSAALRTGLGAYWDRQIASAAVQANISDALGTWQLNLFSGSYSLTAMGLKNLPNSAPVTAAVSADAPAQDVAVDAGGVLTGTIQDEAHSNIANVAVQAWDSTHQLAGEASTDVNGTWSMAVPFGNYEILASGALTRDVSVSSAAATATLKLTRFQLTGRLTDAALAPVLGKVFWGGGNVTAGTLGTYTVSAVQGVNWFLFLPPSTSPSLGFAYQTDVLVNADTAKSLQQ